MGYFQEKIERQNVLRKKLRKGGTYSREDIGPSSFVGLLLMLLEGPGLGGLFGFSMWFARVFPDFVLPFPWWVHPIVLVLSLWVICPLIDRKFFGGRYGDVSDAIDSI